MTGGIPRYVDLMLQDGATTTAEMKNLVGADVNGYLTKLEDQYALVSFASGFVLSSSIGG